jgi:hypothetical protein
MMDEKERKELIKELALKISLHYDEFAPKHKRSWKSKEHKLLSKFMEKR